MVLETKIPDILKDILNNRLATSCTGKKTK